MKPKKTFSYTPHSPILYIDGERLILTKNGRIIVTLIWYAHLDNDRPVTTEEIRKALGSPSSRVMDNFRPSYDPQQYRKVLKRIGKDLWGFNI